MRETIRYRVAFYASTPSYSPVLAVHGHIHESRGETRIGRTLVVNPGSEYNTGRIHGLVARFAGDELTSHQLVVG